MIFLALGANLPNKDGAGPVQSVEAALRAIRRLPDLSGIVRSRWYSSAPLPPSGQPRYINGVVRLTGDMPPEVLLAQLQAIEHAAGRARSLPNAPRTLDLDIIDMHGRVRRAPDPILPHPRAHLRAFVLLPLRDIAPGWRHPVLGAGVQSLIDGLPPQDIRPLDGRD